MWPVDHVMPVGIFVIAKIITSAFKMRNIIFM